LPIPKVVIDTDILSEIVKNQNPHLTSKAIAYVAEHRVFTFTSTTMLEVFSGLYAKDARRQLEKFREFFSTNDQIVPEVEDYELAAEIIGSLTRRGTPIGSLDPIIASCSMRRGLPIATGNVRHYGFVVEAGFPLAIQNWRA